MYDYDVISIGSGPFNLVRMINEILDGSKVAIFEKNNKSGGVWSCINIMGSYHDAVAHLISPFPKAHDVLNSAGINLRPRPIYFWHFEKKLRDFKHANLLKNIPLRCKNNTGLLLEWHQHYAVLTKSNEDFTNTLENQKNTFNSFKYLHNNFSEITNRLEETFLRLGGIQFLGETVNKVDIINNLLTINTGQRKVTSKKLISGRHALADFFIDGEIIKTNVIQNPYNSLLVKFVSLKELKYEYINVIGHPMIGAIQIERTKEYLNNKRIYVCCFITNEIKESDSNDFANQYMKQLFKLGVLNSYQILQTSTYHYKSFSMDTASCDMLNESSNGLMDIKAVYSIGENISQYSNLWTRALAA